MLTGKSEVVFLQHAGFTIQPQGLHNQPCRRGVGWQSLRDNPEASERETINTVQRNNLEIEQAQKGRVHGLVRTHQR